MIWFQCLDASRPWLCYWILHGLDLLEYQLSEEHALRLVAHLKKKKIGVYASRSSKSAVCKLMAPVLNQHVSTICHAVVN